jgi:hypothetical protein
MNLRYTGLDVPVSFDHINKIISSSIGLSNGNVSVVDTELRQYGFDRLVVKIGKGNSVGDRDTALLLEE